MNENSTDTNLSNTPIKKYTKIQLCILINQVERISI